MLSQTYYLNTYHHKIKSEQQPDELKRNSYRRKKISPKINKQSTPTSSRIIMKVKEMSRNLVVTPSLFVVPAKEISSAPSSCSLLLKNQQQSSSSSSLKYQHNDEVTVPSIDMLGIQESKSSTASTSPSSTTFPTISGSGSVGNPAAEEQDENNPAASFSFDDDDDEYFHKDDGDNKAATTIVPVTMGSSGLYKAKPYGSVNGITSGGIFCDQIITKETLDGMCRGDLWYYKLYSTTAAADVANRNNVQEYFHEDEDEEDVLVQYDDPPSPMVLSSFSGDSNDSSSSSSSTVSVSKIAQAFLNNNNGNNRKITKTDRAIQASIEINGLPEPIKHTAVAIGLRKFGERRKTLIERRKEQLNTKYQQSESVVFEKKKTWKKSSNGRYQQKVYIEKKKQTRLS